MKISIPIIYSKGHYESHFLMPDMTVCNLERLAYIYDEHGDKFLCLTTRGSYNDGQSTNKTKTIEVFNEDLNQVPIDKKFFVHAYTEGL